MPAYNSSFVNTELSKPTSIFGLRLWVVIGIFLGSLIVVALFLLSLCLTSRRRGGGPHDAPAAALPISKEILEIVPSEAPRAAPAPEIQIDMGKVEHRVVYSDRYSSGESRGTERTETASLGSGNVGPEVSHLGWGRWYTLRELEEATSVPPYCGTPKLPMAHSYAPFIELGLVTFRLFFCTTNLPAQAPHSSSHTARTSPSFPSPILRSPAAAVSSSSDRIRRRPRRARARNRFSSESRAFRRAKSSPVSSAEEGDVEEREMQKKETCSNESP